MRSLFTNLLDVVVGAEGGAADVDVNVTLVQELLCQFLDLGRPGGGPHEDLTVGTDGPDDFPDLGFESHVQHPKNRRSNIIRVTSTNLIRTGVRRYKSTIVISFELLEWGSIRCKHIV